MVDPCPAGRLGAGLAAGLAAAELARLGPDHLLDAGTAHDDPAPELEAEQLHLAV